MSPLSHTFPVATLAAGALLALSLLFAPNVQAQDGAALYVSRGCESCHGPAGKEPIGSLYPRLAGQQAEYLIAQLQAFRSVERQSAHSAAMWSFSTGLSDAQIRALASYLAKAE